MIIAAKDSLNQWSPLGKKALVYFKDDSLCKNLKYGDLFIISGNLQTVTGPQNPHMFNYRQYLINRGLLTRCYIEPGRWQLVWHTYQKFRQIGR